MRKKRETKVIRVVGEWIFAARQAIWGWSVLAVWAMVEIWLMCKKRLKRSSEQEEAAQGVEHG